MKVYFHLKLDQTIYIELSISIVGSNKLHNIHIKSLENSDLRYKKSVIVNKSLLLKKQYLYSF